MFNVAAKFFVTFKKSFICLLLCDCVSEGFDLKDVFLLVISALIGKKCFYLQRCFSDNCYVMPHNNNNRKLPLTVTVTAVIKKKGREKNYNLTSVQPNKCVLLEN